MKLTEKELKYIYEMCSRLIPMGDVDEFYNELYIILYDSIALKNRYEKLKKSGKLFYYIYGIIQNQYYSKKSKYYYNIKKYDYEKMEHTIYNLEKALHNYDEIYN